MVEEEEETKAEAKTISGGVKKTKNLDSETINKAVEITSEKVNKRLLNQAPKTAGGFEADYNSLKKDLPTFYQYVRNIPLETFHTLFKNTEISAELFAAILKVLNDFGLTSSDQDSLDYASRLLCELSKASSFDMTLMFIDTKEKKDLVTII